MSATFHSVAEHALMVELGDRIDSETHNHVLALDAALTAQPFDGFIESVPAYASLLIRFDPQKTTGGTVQKQVAALLSSAQAPSRAARLHRIGVCYDAPFGPDLAQVAAASGLTVDQVIAQHLAGEYQVHMYGFLPGCAYLAGVPDAIRLPRKPSALRDIPAGSVLIAGAQCIVSPMVMPTGWWIIGRSAIRVLTGDPAKPFLFDIGDRLQFHRISAAEAGLA